MQQSDVNDAMTAYLEHGDIEPWRAVLDGVNAGTVVIEARTNTMTIAVVTRPATMAFGSRLNDLRITSGHTMKQLSDQLRTSPSSVIRQMHGQVLGSWATVVMLIETMGGDPKKFQKDYDKAKAEYRR